MITTLLAKTPPQVPSSFCQRELTPLGLDKAGRRALDFYLSEDRGVEGVSGSPTGAGLPDFSVEGLFDNLPAAQRPLAGLEHDGSGVEQREGFAFGVIRARFARVGSFGGGGTFGHLHGLGGECGGFYAKLPRGDTLRGGFGDEFPQPLAAFNADGLARFEAFTFPAAVGVFADNLDLGEIVGDLDQVDGVDFNFVLLHDLFSCGRVRAGQASDELLQAQFFYHTVVVVPAAEAENLFAQQLPEPANLAVYLGVIGFGGHQPGRDGGDGLGREIFADFIYQRGSVVFVLRHGSVSFPARAARRCGAGLICPLHDGLNFPDSQAVEVFFVTVAGFQGRDFQFLADDTFKNTVHFCGQHDSSPKITGSHIQLSQAALDLGSAHPRNNYQVLDEAGAYLLERIDILPVGLLILAVFQAAGQPVGKAGNLRQQPLLHLREGGFMVWIGRHEVLLFGSVGQRLQLAVVIVNHGVGARVPVEVLLQLEGQVPDFVFIVGRTVVILLAVAADKFHADMFFAGDTADGSEGGRYVLAFLDESGEFYFDNFHGNFSFLLAVAVLLGDEVIEPGGHLVTEQRVEVFQCIPGGLELIFAEVPEYLAQEAGNLREHLGEFGVRFPLGRIFPAGNLVFESLQVICEVGVGFHGSDAFPLVEFRFLAVAILLGDEVIEPAGYLVADQRVEVFQGIPGGLELIFAEVPEYLAQVAGIHREHLGEFGVCLPLSLVFPADNLILESGQVVCEVGVSFHVKSFLVDGLHSISTLTLQSFSP